MKRLVPCLGWMLIFTILPLKRVMALELYGTMNTFYQTTQTKKEDEAKDTTWNLTQGYFLGLSNVINPQMNYSVDLRANINETDVQKTTSIFNTGQFNLTNNLFYSSLGYQIMDRDPSNGSRMTSNSWNLNLNSTMEEIPKIRFQYSQDRNYDHLDTHVTDNRSKQYFSGIQYKYKFINMLFNYSQREREDYVQDTIQENRNYNSKFDFRRSFFGNRLSISGDCNLNHDSSDIKFQSDITLPEEREPVNGLYLYDITPVLDEMGELDSLIDNDDITSTGVDIGSTGEIYHNIGVDLNIPRDCDTIYLYTASNYDPLLSNSYFTWEVYYSNDGINWDLITNNASFEYNTLEYRFEINFSSQQARYFKVVNTSHDERSFIGSIFITEIKIMGSEDRLQGQEDSSTSTRLGTNVVVTYRPMERLTLGYTLSYDKMMNDSESSSSSTDSYEISHGANITCKVHKYLLSSAHYGIRINTTDERKNVNDSFSLQFNSSPLDALNMSLSFNHSEAEETRVVDDGEDGEVEKKHSESDSYLFHITANLWEGVDLSNNFHITQTQSAAGSESIGQTVSLNLRTVLTKKTTLDSGYNHNWQKTENVQGDTTRSESSNVDLILRYSPSGILFLSTDYNLNETEQGTDSSYGFNMSWLATKKIQLNLSSRFKQNDEKTSSYNFDFSWNISRHIIFNSGFNYSKTRGEGKDETQTFYTRLSARL